jgi:hypothetical protein
MPIAYYSRDEIKKILDEARAEWTQPYTKEHGQQVPVSPEQTVHILLDSLKDRFGIKPENR